ncbi:YhgE/Pip domain-containing protein [Mycolicibacterium gilvum]|uniref:YhgE/Pip-like protein n=3 Tax=Mycolicibacterium gilvum TaxID=1804 RepID=E6TG26_MYCSR|nr:YhgE/Pip domain-containing protein [Mycolicibacterium gilvum]ABP44232.1 ABC-2 type transporter [Mycolicibacterium gilvum PYR-GCK]ADT97819.1 YhgE/Pip-like protein [Mycolicibacterium gilvum Spyr1]MCV7057197.1 YhgE/Pip domain-containing protein [Mycolicibacterium gilvum]STZ45448.1 ABC-2 type transporter [Mycolicibacterium gilvum]
MALAGMSLGTDLSRYFHGRLPRIALATIIVMPLLYGAMYLWAFWNPFAEVNKVPVALVNEDRGASAQGQDLRAGDEVARALIDSGQLHLTEMSAQEAAEGVAAGDYYFSITLPEDFSASVASPSGGDPRQATIRFTFNDANNYLASVIGQNASREIVNQVNAEIGERSVGTVVTGLTDAGQGLQQAADGAQQLATGLGTADDGARRLAGGADTLSSGLNTAQDGSAELAAGTQRLATSIDKTTGPLLEMLDRVGAVGLNPDDVAVAAQHLSGAVRSTTDRLAALNVNTAQAAAIVDHSVGFLQSSPDPAVRDAGHALAGAQRLLRAQGIDPTTDEGLIRLRDSASRLESELGDPQSTLRVFLARALNGGLRSDVASLRDGVDQLNSGAQRLADGLVQLAGGGRELAAGAHDLAEGTGKLRAGGQELATRLRDGSTQIPSWTPQQRTEVARTLAAPVGADLVTDNPAPTFGTGFAPFFLPLALFIGALIVWMLLSPLRSRPIVNGLGALRVVLASFWPALLVVVCQVFVMYVVVHFGVGLQAKHPVATVGFLVLIGGTFLALIQAFNALFGVAVGRVVTLAFLMLQLVSAGGIYPVETTAKPFQILHPFDPMTYAVNGLRQLTVGGVDSRLWVGIGVLAGLLAASLATSAWAARRNRQYTVDRLRPPIEV